MSEVIKDENTVTITMTTSEWDSLESRLKELEDFIKLSNSLYFYPKGQITL